MKYNTCHTVETAVIIKKKKYSGAFSRAQDSLYWLTNYVFSEDIMSQMKRTCLLVYCFTVTDKSSFNLQKCPNHSLLIC